MSKSAPKKPLPRREPLTVEILRKLEFRFQFHLNGGSEYSIRTSTNDEWGIGVTTETNGSPDFEITGKTLFKISDHDICLDMLKKPMDLEAFVAAYNASQSA